MTMRAKVPVWRTEDKLRASVLSFHGQSSRGQPRSSGLAASSFTWGAIMLDSMSISVGSSCHMCGVYNQPLLSEEVMVLSPIESLCAQVSDHYLLCELKPSLGL